MVEPMSERLVVRVNAVAPAAREIGDCQAMQSSSIPLKSDSVLSNRGVFAYAAGAVFLGLLGLASGDFATTWQHVGANVPFRALLA